MPLYFRFAFRSFSLHPLAEPAASPRAIFPREQGDYGDARLHSSLPLWFFKRRFSLDSRAAADAGARALCARRGREGPAFYEGDATPCSNCSPTLLYVRPEHTLESGETPAQFRLIKLFIRIFHPASHFAGAPSKIPLEKHARLWAYRRAVWGIIRCAHLKCVVFYLRLFIGEMSEYLIMACARKVDKFYFK